MVKLSKKTEAEMFCRPNEISFIGLKSSEASSRGDKGYQYKWVCMHKSVTGKDETSSGKKWD